MATTPNTRPPRPDRLFRALADPTRLAILRLLGSPGAANACGAARGAASDDAGERCVCDLVAALRVPQPTASRHLAYLRRAGLVEARKQGPWSYYRLSTPRTPLHRRLLDCLECCGQVCGRASRDAERFANGVGRNGRCC
jgi:ArsR family transcriptional regulator